MKIKDPGHRYFLQHLESPDVEMLTFVKRSSELITHPNEFPGTTTQEVIRAAIDRTLYVDRLLPALENDLALRGLREALFWYEARAYRRKALALNKSANENETPIALPFVIDNIERHPICANCGHIFCKGH